VTVLFGEGAGVLMPAETSEQQAVVVQYLPLARDGGVYGQHERLLYRPGITSVEELAS
jgi:hypothetical protein